MCALRCPVSAHFHFNSGLPRNGTRSKTKASAATIRIRAGELPGSKVRDISRGAEIKNLLVIRKHAI